MSGSSQKRATGSIAITSDQFRDDCRNAGGRHVARSFCNDGAALRCHSFSTASRIGTANLPWEPSRKIALVWGLRTEYGLNESEVVAVRRFLETLAVNIPGRSRTCNLRLRSSPGYPFAFRMRSKTPVFTGVLLCQPYPNAFPKRRKCALVGGLVGGLKLADFDHELLGGSL